MSVVVDANMAVALVLPCPYSEQAAARIAAWKQAGIELLAPTLLEYEVSSVLRKAVAVGRLSASDVAFSDTAPVTPSYSPLLACPRAYVPGPPGYIR